MSTINLKNESMPPVDLVMSILDQPVIQKPEEPEERVKIAIIMDYDDTITVRYSQEQMVEKNIENIKKFYKEHHNIMVETAADYWNIVTELYKGGSKEVSYLSCLMRDFENGVITGRSGEKMKVDDLLYYGSLSPLAPGIKDFLKEIKKEHDVDLRIYVVSVGMKNLIMGSGIGDLVDGVYSCELKQSFKDYVDTIHRVVVSFSKSEEYIRIVKGVLPDNEDVLNKRLTQDEYFLQYDHTIIVGDGMSDKPLFMFAGKKGAKRIAVYSPGNRYSFKKCVSELITDGAIDALVPRDYTPGGQTFRLFSDMISAMARAGEGCGFPPYLLYQYRKGILCSSEVIDFVKSHISTCPNCTDHTDVAIIYPR